MRKVIIPSVIVLVLGGTLVIKRVATKDESPAQKTSQEIGREPANVGVSPEKNNLSLVPNLNAAKAEAKKETASTLAAKTKTFALSKEVMRDLNTFAELKKKIFLSDNEKLERSRLIRDRNLMRSFHPLLKVPAEPGTETMDLQNAALDLLLEARASGSQQDAGEVLRAVIEDKQIEDTKLDMQSRSALAGVKAEVLYQWSSQEPHNANEMQRWLPGPVSNKIWKNVQAAQRNNQLESSMEMKK